MLFLRIKREGPCIADTIGHLLNFSRGASLVTTSLVYTNFTYSLCYSSSLIVITTLCLSTHIECNLNIFNMLSQPPFLSSLVEKLQNADETAALLSDIDAARQALTAPSSLRVFLAGNLDSIAETEVHGGDYLWMNFTSSSSSDQ